MPRRARVEIEGALYHVITRGNNRRQIFNSAADYEKFLSLLAKQKRRLPFFLYAYCLMTNHVHLLLSGRRTRSAALCPRPSKMARPRRCAASLRLAGRPLSLLRVFDP